MARLRSVMLLLNDVPKTANFFREGLGLPVAEVNERFAEVQAGDINIVLKASDGLASSTTGYSPFLQFDVEDMDSTIVQLISHGGVLDGPIKYPSAGKIAAMRAPCGHMLGLFEPNLDWMLLEQRRAQRPNAPPNGPSDAKPDASPST